MTPIPVSPDKGFLKKIFIHQLTRIYNGKCFLRRNLPELMKLASFKGLNLAMEEFAEDVIKQIARMEEIYQLIGETPDDDDCNPIKSIIKDQFCLDENQHIPLLNDLDLMLYVQLLEHVNITSYRMMLMLSKLLGYTEVTQLLVENFDESQDNDKLFLLIAKEYVTGEQAQNKQVLNGGF